MPVSRLEYEHLLYTLPQRYSEVASSSLHHLHEPPDIKHNRKPAPGISFAAPNLSTLIGDCIALGADPTARSPAECDQS